MENILKAIDYIENAMANKEVKPEYNDIIEDILLQLYDITE